MIQEITIEATFVKGESSFCDVYSPINLNDAIEAIINMFKNDAESISIVIETLEFVANMKTETCKTAEDMIAFSEMVGHFEKYYNSRIKVRTERVHNHNVTRFYKVTEERHSVNMVCEAVNILTTKTL